MFKRRDIPPVLLLLLLIVLVMLTLSQILVVHNGRYGRNIHSIRRLQMELKEIDVNLQTMMLQNVPSIELNRRLLQNEINARRVADILAEASKPDVRFLPPSHPNRTASTSASTSLLIPSSVADRLPPNADYSDELDSSSSSLLSNRQLPVSSEAYADVRTNRSVDGANATTVVGGLGRWSEQLRVASTTDDDDDVISSPLNVTIVDRRTDRRVMTSNSTTLSEPAAHITSPSATKYCPPVPPDLKGQIFIDFEHKHDYTEADIIRQNACVLPGGIGRPRDCVARHKVAIIVPYRDRQTHLAILLSHLHPMLQRQQLDYRIYVVEQYGEYTFNKARIMNIAFVEALKQYGFQCFVFHDVDLVPEDDRNMYSCPTQPRHMSVAIDEMGYKLAYQELVGGVLNMRTEHFQRVNGYSNLYWGWGAEDDDMAYRIMYVGLKITRPPENIARYKMIKHTKRKPSDWRKRTKLLYTGTRRFQFDGLNSLQYRLIHIVNTALYTHILVDIGKPPKGF